MKDFVKCNKFSGIRWIKGCIENVKIKVKLKPQAGTISLPKYEEYTNTSEHIDIQQLEANKVEEYSFNWQEKVFSQGQIQRYRDIQGCISDTELNYYAMIQNESAQSSKVFTYVHEDFHLSLPFKKKIKTDNFLSACLDKLNLTEKMEAVDGLSSSRSYLFRSEEDVTDQQWTAMHVMYDNSEYNEDSQILFKQECLLLSLYHNSTLNYVVLSPNVNDLLLNPYVVETGADVMNMEYGVEVDFQEQGNTDDLNILLTKLLRKWEKKQRMLLNFATPPLGKKKYYVTVDIVSAAAFDLDDIYIEYHIKIPDNMVCNDPLQGRTHISKAVTDEVNEWRFGHIIELQLEASTGIDASPITIYLEAISTDWWGRHRTEGYTRLSVSLEPGRFSRRLVCCRPEELDPVEAESRRFFVGGCHLIKDLDVLAVPQLQDANFRYTTTGSIYMRWDIITQTALPCVTSTPSTSSSILQGADAVLRQYKKARAKLAEATRDLDVRLNEFTDG